MTRVYVQGIGAVSPAGWGVDPLQQAATRGEALPTQPLARPGWQRGFRVRPVPLPPARPAFASHARLRRAGPISHHTVAASMEALSTLPATPGATAPALGVIVCVMAGGISYSRRFFSEVIENPATASPLVFPETVFNAPASHLATLLGATAESATLVGDEGAFLQGVALAADWLDRGAVDRCVVVGAEELDWLVSDAIRLFTRNAIHAEGAGALCLGVEPPDSAGPTLELVTHAHTYNPRLKRAEAARRMRSEFPPEASDDLLVAGQSGLGSDRAEASAWWDWRGARLAPGLVLGCGFNALSAWQCVLACAALRDGSHPAATVSVVGANQQAVGVRFRACPLPASATGSRPKAAVQMT